MKEVLIQPIETLAIPGVTVQLPGASDVYEESYLKWMGTRLPVSFGSNRIAGGVLRVWRHVPEFQKLEYHDDREKFIFLCGDVVMPFADVRDGAVEESTLCYAYIKAGTELIIEAGKAHFMPVAVSDTALMSVVCPEMPFYHVFLQEPVRGVFPKED